MLHNKYTCLNTCFIHFYTAKLMRILCFKRMHLSGPLTLLIPKMCISSDGHLSEGHTVGGNPWQPLVQWLFLVPLKGGIGGIVHPPIGRYVIIPHHLYTTKKVLAEPGGWKKMLPTDPTFWGTRNNNRWLVEGEDFQPLKFFTNASPLHLKIPMGPLVNEEMNWSWIMALGEPFVGTFGGCTIGFPPEFHRVCSSTN